MVAQDVGGAVAFCKGHMDMEGEAKPTALAHLPTLGHTHTLPAIWAMPHWALTLAQPLCVPLHTRACWSPGGLGAVLSYPQLSHRAAACSGTASLGKGHGECRDEGERLWVA